MPEAPAPTDATKLTDWAIQCLRPEIRAPNEMEAVDLAIKVWNAANERINPTPPAAKAAKKENAGSSTAKTKVQRRP